MAAPARPRRALGTRARRVCAGAPRRRRSAQRARGACGGEAALLGAGASFAGMGSDGGGSIRVPSHYCGIAGLRPTAGLVPETGCWPPTRDTGMLDMNTVGPMARYVDDLALLLPVL